MDKLIRAYFRNENDVESTHAELNKLQIHDVVIDEIPNDGGTGPLPLANTNSGTSAIPAFVGPVDEVINEDSDDLPSYLLECKVIHDDYQQALNIIENSKGHIDSSSL